jgi:hypothetical protein
MKTPSRIGLIACRVFEDEIALHGRGLPRFVETRFLEVGLHDRPQELRRTLQLEIDRMDARGGLDVIVLAYALCGLGTAGLRAGTVPLVIPRAHDCITVFMGCKNRFACQQAACPDSYYFTPGWMKAKRTPGFERLESLREELSKKFEPEDVEYLLEAEVANWAQHGRAVFLDLGTRGADSRAEEAEASARELGWKFERLPGDPALLKDLLSGSWDDERFLVVPPGASIAHSPDDRIFRVVPGW